MGGGGEGGGLVFKNFFSALRPLGWLLQNTDVLKNCKIVQHRLSPGLIRLCQIIRWCTKFSKVVYLKERGKRHLLVTMFKEFNKNCPTLFRSGFIEPLKFTTTIWGVLTMNTDYRYLKRIFLSVHFLIGVQWLGTNCQIKQAR